MNRNNFLIHLALAIVLILIAAFAGQLNRWRKEWKTRVRVMPVAEKKRPSTAADIALAESRIPGRPELLVKFKSGVSPRTIEELTARFHDHVEDRIENAPGWASIDDLDDVNPYLAVAQYLGQPEVEYAEPNFEIQLPEFTKELLPVIHPTDPRFEDQWALANSGQRGGTVGADISAMRAWATTIGSDKVVVAVLDSGVDYMHEDLAPNMWKRPASVAPYRDEDLGTIDDENGFNAVDNAADPMDENGHGTHCAGIIGAEGGNDIGITGVNWKIRIMPLKFMNAGGFGTTKDAVEAINYVIDRKKAGVNVRIISASWGSTQKSRALEDVIRKAYENDILFVAASGNATTNNDRSPHYPSSYNVPNVVSVAALDRHDQLARFSNWGVKSVAIAAPGVDILSTWLGNQYEEKSGTSMATPVVSGVAALIVSKNQRISVDELKKRLLAAVDPLPVLKGKVATGGRVNAARALQ
ncbi:MAG TPA: S8 family peptidase [Pyrinomonadaceae bacterium]|jgi:subtilisin family serine protease|nr:S8 family peptidase [Pyrinomonadaceae bacterium]